MKRFHRTELLFGQAALKAFRQATVAVAGLGAVGSFAVEALARSGIGRLRIADFDELRESNINRQLLALNSTLGQSKVDVARSRILDINPDCVVEAHNLFIDQDNAPAFLTPTPIVLIDAMDSLNPKTGLLHAAVTAQVPTIISCMGAANRTDPFSARADDLSKTIHCHLARLIRKRLKKFNIRTGIRCIYSIEPVRKIEADEPQDQILARGRVRKALGSCASITGMFGLLAAHEALQAILKSTPS